MADYKPVYYKPGPWNKTARERCHTSDALVWGHDDAPNQKSPGELEELMGEYLHSIPDNHWRHGREVKYGAFQKSRNRDERQEGMMVYESRESTSDSESSLWKFNIVMAADDDLANLDKIEEGLRDYPMLATGSSQRVLIHKFQKPEGGHATDHTLRFRTWKCRSCTIGLTMHGDLTRSGNDRGIRHVYIQNDMNTTNESLAQEMANLLCHLVLYTPPFPDAFGGLNYHKGHRQTVSPGALPSAPRPPSSSGSRGAAQPPTPVKLSTSIPPPPRQRPLALAAPPPRTSVPMPPPGDWGHVAPAGAATPPAPAKMEVSEIPLGQSVSEVVEVPVAQETPPEPTNALPSTQEEPEIMPSTGLGFAWK